MGALPFEPESDVEVFMHRVGPYRMIRPLGACQVGAVWFAVDTEGGEVTIALLNEATASDPRWRAAFSATVSALIQSSGMRTPQADFAAPAPWVAVLTDSGPGAAQIFVALGQDYRPVAAEAPTAPISSAGSAAAGSVAAGSVGPVGPVAHPPGVPGSGWATPAGSPWTAGAPAATFSAPDSADVPTVARPVSGPPVTSVPTVPGPGDLAPAPPVAGGLATVSSVADGLAAPHWPGGLAPVSGPGGLAPAPASLALPAVGPAFPARAAFPPGAAFPPTDVRSYGGGSIVPVEALPDFLSGGTSSAVSVRSFPELAAPELRPARGRKIWLAAAAVLGILLGGGGAVAFYETRPGNQVAVGPTPTSSSTPAASPTPFSTPSPNRPGLEPPTAGAWPAAWPLFAQGEQTRSNNLTGRVPNFRIPRAWACNRTDNVRGYSRHTCGSKLGTPEAIGGEIIVRDCSHPCDAKRQTELRRAEEGWGLQWTAANSTTTWVESASVDNLPTYGVVIVMFFRSTTYERLNREVIFRMTGRPASAAEIQKVANSLRGVLVV